MRLLTADRLRELLRFDEETGQFYWRFDHSPRARAGQLAGTKDSKGYIQVKIDRRLYLAHRLVWLYAYGIWPSDQLDHIDGVPVNNRRSNLRECSHDQNQENLPVRKDNSCGLTGVSWDVSRKSWRAEISKHRHRYRLGHYATKELAHEAYLAAKRELHKFQPMPRSAA